MKCPLLPERFYDKDGCIPIGRFSLNENEALLVWRRALIRAEMSDKRLEFARYLAQTGKIKG